MPAPENIVAMELQDIAKFLINPVLYLFIGLAILLLTKKQRRKLILFLILFLYIISIPFTGHLFSKVWKVNDTLSPQKTYDAVVVLSGVSDSTWHLERADIPYIPEDFFASDDGTDRILAGIYFVQSGKAGLLLIGDSVRVSRTYGISRIYREGRYAKKLAADMGLKERQIHIYGEVRKTLNEAEKVRKYVQDNHIKRLLLVTSEMHMRRAHAMFRKQGLEPDVFSVNKGKNITPDSFVPQARGFRNTEECLYEVVAYVSYFFKGNL